MKILVLNGSPKRERSDCMKLTRAFLDGMGETARVIHTIDQNVKPCLGCFGCWHVTPGTCVQRDDMDALLPMITESELVIFSMPLYCYGMPATLKAIVDRILPLTTQAQKVDEHGHTYHPTRKENHTRFMLISGSGFPNLEGNFEALTLQFGRLFGAGFPRILCVESPLLSIEEAKPVALPYLALVKQAGAEFARTGAISPDTQRALDTPMLDPDEYRRACSGE